MVQLTDDEILGLKVLALRNSGELSMLDCSACKYKEELNCDMKNSRGPVFTITEFGDDIELTTCPLHYVPPHLYEFVEEFQFYDKWGGLGGFGDVSARWHTASVYYQGFLNTVHNYKMKQSLKK